MATGTQSDQVFWIVAASFRHLIHMMEIQRESVSTGWNRAPIASLRQYERSNLLTEVLSFNGTGFCFCHVGLRPLLPYSVCWPEVPSGVPERGCSTQTFVSWRHRQSGAVPNPLAEAD